MVAETVLTGPMTWPLDCQTLVILVLECAVFRRSCFFNKLNNKTSQWAGLDSLFKRLEDKMTILKFFKIN
jgi:hypothetical protein